MDSQVVQNNNGLEFKFLSDGELTRLNKDIEDIDERL